MGELYYYRLLGDEARKPLSNVYKLYELTFPYSDKSKDIIYSNLQNLDSAYRMFIAEFTLEILDELEAFRDRGYYELGYKLGRVTSPVFPDKPVRHALQLIAHGLMRDDIKKMLNELREDIFTLLCEIIDAENKLCKYFS